MSKVIEWYNEGIYRCSRCESIFKVCILNEEVSINENVCPICGVTGVLLESVDEDELEDYIE